MPTIPIAPSILTADLTRLGEQLREAEQGGADWFHLDVMDGHFVPNITIGPLVVSAVRSATSLPIEVHLMIAHPERYLAEFVAAGADRVIVHAEAALHLHRTLQATKELGAQAAVTLNPATPLATLEEILSEVDLVLVMSVNPGFGGQHYIPSSTLKIRRLRQMLDAANSSAILEVDGGVSLDNAATIVAAGATALVAGSSVYNSRGSVAENIGALKRAAVQSD